MNVGRCKAVLEFGCIDCGLCCIDSLVAFALVLIFDLRVGRWLVVGFSVGGWVVVSAVGGFCGWVGGFAAFAVFWVAMI